MCGGTLILAPRKLRQETVQVQARLRYRKFHIRLRHIRKGQQEFHEKVESRDWFSIQLRPGRKAIYTNNQQIKIS